MLIKGENLTTAQRQQVLSAFIYRWTNENPQRTQVYRCGAELTSTDIDLGGCTQCGTPITTQRSDDDE